MLKRPTGGLIGLREPAGAYLGLVQPLSEAVHRYLATFLCHQAPLSLLYLPVCLQRRSAANPASLGGLRYRHNVRQLVLNARARLPAGTKEIFGNSSPCFQNQFSLSVPPVRPLCNSCRSTARPDGSACSLPV